MAMLLFTKTGDGLAGTKVLSTYDTSSLIVLMLRITRARANTRLGVGIATTFGGLWGAKSGGGMTSSPRSIRHDMPGREQRATVDML